MNCKAAKLKMRSTLLIFFNEENEDWRKENSTFFNFFSMKKQPKVVFYKKGVLKNFKKFTEKHLCWNVLFLIKLQAWSLYEKRDFFPVGSLNRFCSVSFSSVRLLLSMKRTKNCLYCSQSCKYDRKIKKKDCWWLNYVQW